MRGGARPRPGAEPRAFHGDPLSSVRSTHDPDELMTANHGNDPTKDGTTDHTREYVPILAAGAKVRAGTDVGTRVSFADIGATVEEALAGSHSGARSFLAQITSP